MYKHSEMQRIMAMVLSVIMILGLMPVSAAAGTLPVGASGEILAFEKLAPEIVTQTVPLGTGKSGLNLPNTLAATVRLASEGQHDLVTGSVYSSAATGSAITVNGGDQEEKQDSGAADTPGSVSMNIPATWTSSPEYNGNTAGVYTFTAKIADYTLSAEPPVITVTVGETAGTVTAFETLADDIRWQNTALPVLPQTVSGTVEGKSIQVPVTWEADHDYNAENPVKGLYVFTAVLGGGYTLAGGVEAPRVTVYIPAVRRMLARMVGGGTASSPLEITTAAQLAEIAALVNAGRLETFLFNDGNAVVSLELVNDLDLSDYGKNWNAGKGWIPIGTDANQFKGCFDGKDHTVAGLYINDNTRNYAGLFGYASSSGSQSIHNLSLTHVEISAGGGTGGIVGKTDKTQVYGCSVSGTIQGSGSVGGVVGYVEYSAVENCYATGSVSGAGNCIGGVAGYVEYSTVENCCTTGSVSGAGYYVGGVAGAVVNGSTLRNCAALNPSVTGQTNVGRVAGYITTTLTNNYAFSGMTVNDGTVSSSDGGSINGADKTAADLQASTGFPTGFNSTPWTYEAGKLPGLFGAAADMPLYLHFPSAPFEGGGTAGSPYQITTAAQLAKLAELVNAGNADYNSKYYQLQNGLDLSDYGMSYNDGKGWTPIGNEANRFMGTFDGNNYTISGLYIHDIYRDYAGLFGYAGTSNSQSIHNFQLTRVEIFAGGSTGGIVGRSNTTRVYNCSVSGTIQGSGNVGGVAGYMDSSTIQDCCSTSGDVIGTVNIGGVAGYMDSSTIQDCCSISSVADGTDNIGGVVGCMYNSPGNNCYATGAVLGTGNYIGGVVGRFLCGTNAPFPVLKNCAALQSILKGYNSATMGRIAGYSDYTLSFANNYAFSDMKVNDHTVSCSSGSDMNGADKSVDELKALSGYPSGFNSTPWTYQAGKLPGLFGAAADMPSYLPVVASPFEGSGSEDVPYKITSAAQLAKLAALVNAGEEDYIDKHYALQNDLDLSAYASGEGWVPIGNFGSRFKGSFDGGGHKITGLRINRPGNDPENDYQGLFGVVLNGTVKNLGVVGASIIGRYCVGGVAGIMDTGTVQNCYVTGAVSGNQRVGGVAGIMDTGIVQNCYVTGAVSGNQTVGGVAGYVASGTLQNCYATGAVSGTANVGGVAGEVDYGTVKNCAALNPGVTGITASGRVAGYNHNGYILTNNYAFSGMKVNGSIVSGGAADNANGANVSALDANTPLFWTTGSNWTSSWNSEVWTFTTGRLPALTGFSGQSSDGGVYLTVRNFQHAAVTLSPNSYVYDGTAKMPGITVTFDGQTLVKDTDYTVETTSTDGEGTSTGTQAGTVTLTLTGIGNFTGTTDVTYTIGKATLTADDFNYSLTSVTYNGSEQGVAVSPKAGKTGIGAVTVRYNGGAAKPISADTYAVTLNIAEGSNYAAANVELGNFIINKATPTAADLNYNLASVTYNGSEQGVAVSLKAGKTGLGAVTVRYNGSVAKPFNADTYAVALDITEGSNYYAASSVSLGDFIINKATLTADDFNYSLASVAYNGSEQGVAVSLKAGKTGFGAVTVRYNGSVVKPFNADTYAVTLDITEGSNYTAANVELGDFIINKTTPTAADFDYSLTPVTYKDSGQWVVVLPKIGKSGLGNAAIRYNGSTNPPINAGTYAVTLDITEGINYHAASNVSLGDFIINKAIIAGPVTWNMDVYKNRAMDYPMDYATFSGKLIALTGKRLGDITCSITAIDNTNGVLAEEPPAGLFTFPAALRVAKVAEMGKTATIIGTVSSANYDDFTLKMVFTTTTGIPLSIAFDPNGGTRTGGGELFQMVEEGSDATAPVVTRSGYTFNGWDKDFTNIRGSIMVTALWEYNSNSGAGSGSSGGSGLNEPTPTAVPEKKVDQPVSAGVTVAAKADKGGLAAAAVSEQSIASAIAKAQADAKANGTADNGIGVALNVTMPKKSASLNLMLTLKGLQSLIDANVSNLEINGAPVSLGFDLKAMQEIQKQSTGNITVSITPVTGLSSVAKELIGTRPVYNISISYVKDGKTVSIASLGNGTSTLSIPYTPDKKEAAGYLFGVYVDAKGNATRIADSAYDSNSRNIIFGSNHFSVYGVGYTAPSEKYKDIPSHWAKESIDYVIGRGLLSGTSTTTFSPDTAMSRGMLVTALGRLAGVDVSDYKTASFTDVEADKDYAPYIEWAYKKGIISGVGNGQFAPGRAITHEEAALIFSNYAAATGYTLPVTRETAVFADDSTIGSSYQTAVKAVQQAGIMMGGIGNKFNPKVSATRAEVSAMLHRYIMLTIDPATAQGWGENDAGQRLYYKDGKALTGWQTVGSGERKKKYYFTVDAVMVAGKWYKVEDKWYYFYKDGSLAVSTKVDGYEVDENGVRQSK